MTSIAIIQITCMISIITALTSKFFSIYLTINPDESFGTLSQDAEELYTWAHIVDTKVCLFLIKNRKLTPPPKKKLINFEEIYYYSITDLLKI